MDRRYLIAMVAGIVVVLLVAMAVVWRTSPVTVQQRSPTATQPAPAPPVAVPTPPPRTGSNRIPLQDIADPLEAVEIVHLRRGAGDTIEIGARNRSKRAVFVKSVDLFAESDELVPLDNVGFWLPVGGSAETRREVPELSRRLGENETIKAVINEAEFRDTPPEGLAK